MTEAEYEEIVNNSWKETFRFVSRRVSVLDDAEEITLDIFLRLWQNKNKIDPDKVNFWLKRVAGNCVADFYRSRGTRKVLDEVGIWHAVGMRHPMNLLREHCIREEMEEVIDAIDNHLTDQQVIIIHLYFGCGKTWTQIAHEIGLKPGAVQQCKDRAIGKLRSVLGDWGSLFSGA